MFPEFTYIALNKNIIASTSDDEKMIMISPWIGMEEPMGGQWRGNAPPPYASGPLLMLQTQVARMRGKSGRLLMIDHDARTYERLYEYHLAAESRRNIKQTPAQQRATQMRNNVDILNIVNGETRETGRYPLIRRYIK